MRKPNMGECRNCVEMAWVNHREFLRIRRCAKTFTAGPARDKMFLLAGEYAGRARGYMREARSHHTDYLSAKFRRIVRKAA